MPEFLSKERISRPITPDGEVGFDCHGQLWTFYDDPERGGVIGRVISDVRCKVCPICNREWELTGESFRDQAWSDVAECHVHSTCLKGHRFMVEADFWIGALVEAFSPFHIVWQRTRIPNEYASNGTPWYRITFPRYIPHLKLGSRKRVYHMSLHDLSIEQMKLFNQFDLEETTKECDGSKGTMLIHAWNDKKAAQYLSSFAQIINLDPALAESKTSEAARVT